LATFGLLYVSEGIPLGFAAVAIAAHMQRQGLDVAKIGAFVGAFYLPWAFKWAWAPVVDLVRLERFGGRKAWIVLCQAAMIVTLLAVARLDFAQHFDLLIALVIVHNVFSATQDIAIDALAIVTLPDRERATANGFMFAGAYLGQGLGGGAAMLVSDRWGFDVSVAFVCALLMLLFGFVLVFVRDSSVAERTVRAASSLLVSLTARLAAFLRELVHGLIHSGRGPAVGVAFALLPMGAMVLTGAVSVALQVDIGMTDAQIAELNIYQTVVTGIGCVVGGGLADRFGHRKMLALWYLLTVVPTLYLALQLTAGGGPQGLSIQQYYWASLVFSACMGLHFATSAALFMGLTSPLVAATQFTGYMALRNVTISYSNAWQGAVVGTHGYAAALYIDSALVVLPLLLLPFLTPPTRGPREPSRAREATLETA
jgi:PAT family beta-lactamase induction signal transducer AmpG